MVTMAPIVSAPADSLMPSSPDTRAKVHDQGGRDLSCLQPYQHIRSTGQRYGAVALREQATGLLDGRRSDVFKLPHDQAPKC